jgi:hypothetical protein
LWRNQGAIQSFSAKSTRLVRTIFDAGHKYSTKICTPIHIFKKNVLSRLPWEAKNKVTVDIGAKSESPVYGKKNCGYLKTKCREKYF